MRAAAATAVADMQNAMQGAGFSAVDPLVLALNMNGIDLSALGRAALTAVHLAGWAVTQ